MRKQKPLCVQFRMNGWTGLSHRPIVVMVRLAGEKKYATCQTGVYIHVPKWQPYLRQKLHPSIIREKSVEARLDSVRSLVQQIYTKQKNRQFIHNAGPVTGRTLIREFRNIVKGGEGQPND